MSEPAAGQPGTRRGRKHIVPDAGAGPVARFARALLDLKREAGDPSYDRMRTELGAAASKSALSAATRGRSMPSWPTTWEFVRSLAVTGLGRDEETVRRAWLARWEEAAEGQPADPAWGAASPAGRVPDLAEGASSAERPGAGDWTSPAGRGPDPAEGASSAERPGTGDWTSPAGEPSPAPQPSPDADPAIAAPSAAPEPAAAKTRRWGSIVVVATVLVVLGLVAAVVVLATPSSRDKEAAVPHYPLPGDSSGFGGDGLPGDVTFPDGAKARYGQTFTKIWRLKNTGSVPWRSRYLQVAGGTTVLCPSPPRVPVPDAEPGQLVEVSVPVTPTGTGVCHVLWKMVDERGALVFPDRTGIFYQVTVAAE
ncbi:NBR1-Ig-like domain-containing protein [Amycolatopsis rubida]|uniref:Ig-like domain-containing protein n=1 Tax=Amycolatopsis rubida TaxID=112413 RepID=A0A1I6AXB0_9PSEU|nr:NBR1-Ig-like domain-containing protein [Amycolatopsis rubida]SFQ73355.1 Ig-like domain-containing protein [Amycolatopsis rubida]